MKQHPARLFCALWTPFDADLRLDEAALRSTLEFVLEQKVHGIMALGSTGEFLQLSTAERKTVFRIISQAAPEHSLIANASHVRSREAIELGLHAREHGARAIALLPPWFYPMAQPDIAAFMIRVAEAVQLPLLIYNFPEMTGKRVELETIRAIASAVPVAAVKQSGGDFDYHRDLGKLARELNFLLLTGADTSFAEAAELGATGMVSGLANAVPEVLARIYQAVTEGSPDRAARELAFMKHLGEAMGRISFPLNIRAAMQARGIATGPPKSPVSPETLRAAEALASDLRALYRTARLF